MTKEQYERVNDALVSFIERAAKPLATDADVSALASVAHVLTELHGVVPTAWNRVGGDLLTCRGSPGRTKA